MNIAYVNTAHISKEDNQILEAIEKYGGFKTLGIYFNPDDAGCIINTGLGEYDNDTDNYEIFYDYLDIEDNLLEFGFSSAFTRLIKWAQTQKYQFILLDPVYDRIETLEVFDW